MRQTTYALGNACVGSENVNFDIWKIKKQAECFTTTSYTSLKFFIEVSIAKLSSILSGVCGETVWWRGDQIPVGHVYPTVLIQGRVIPSNRLKLMEMCRWIGSHFHDCIDYNGVTFSKELLEWGRTLGFGGQKVLWI